MRRMAAAVVALLGFSVALYAQAPDSGGGARVELRRLINAIAIDAKAIDDLPDTQPPDTLLQLANEIGGYARQLRVLAPDAPTVQRILVQLTEASGRLMGDAYNQDRFAAAGDARDVLDTVTRLRSTLGL